MITKEGRSIALLTIATHALQGCEVILFENDLTPDADTVLSNLTEPTWEGYTPPTLGPWTVTMRESDGMAEAISEGVTFLPGSGASGLIYGYALLNSDDECPLITRFPGAPLTVAEGVPLSFRLIYDFTQG